MEMYAGAKAFLGLFKTWKQNVLVGRRQASGFTPRVYDNDQTTWRRLNVVFPC